ncbi:MAG: hypothetical protein ABJL99_27725 [Aliishimia sp.]
MAGRADPDWPCFDHPKHGDLLCNSSQAKARVERKNRMLQARLIKELRLADIFAMDAANAVLPNFTERCNIKFAKAPRRAGNLHRTMNIEPDQLRDIFCFRDERLVSAQLALSYERKRSIRVENEITRSLPGKYVDTYAYPNVYAQIIAGDI